MIERPILFSAPMIRAILDGRKTQTRRILKVQPPDERFQVCTLFDSTAREDKKKIGKSHWCRVDGLEILEAGKEYFKSPYGLVGDRLWVREAWLPDPPVDVPGDDFEYYDFTDGTLHNWNALPEKYRNPKHIIYQASWDKPDEYKWIPSIHMFRWASRITLEIKSLKIQRLQDLSEEDAKSEGIVELTKDGKLWKYGLANHEDLPLIPDWPWTEWKHTAKEAFARLWDSINPGIHDWHGNPWVWVIEFKKLDALESAPSISQEAVC